MVVFELLIWVIFLGCSLQPLREVLLLNLLMAMGLLKKQLFGSACSSRYNCANLV